MISNLDLKNIFLSTNIVVHKTCFQDANAINKLYLVLYLGRKVNHELRFQMHELLVQIYKLRVQIHKLRVQIHELRVQIHELRVQIQELEHKKRELGD